MAYVKIKTPPEDGEIKEIREYLSELAIQLGYILENLDEENHTEKYNERTKNN